MKRRIISLLFSVLCAMPVARPALAATLEGSVTGIKAVGNLVVFVAKAPGNFAPPKEHARIDQLHIKFVPRILPIVAGTTVDFVNSDSVNHNVFSPDHEGYNLGTGPKGELRTYVFKREGVYTQLCSLHPEMEAFVVVLGNPYFAVTAADGKFSMANVPPGQYQVQVWGEKLKESQHKRVFPVTLPATGAKLLIAL